METMKNSSIQVIVKVDRNYSEKKTEQLIKKIKKEVQTRGRS
jgi:hypothetical protein